MMTNRIQCARRMLPQGLIALAICLLAVPPACGSDDASRISVNAEFADGLTGWHASGAVHVERGATPSGKHGVTIGPGAGSIAQLVEVDAANHMIVSVRLHAEPVGAGKVTLRFLDGSGNELMSLSSPAEIRPGKEPGSFEEYFRPHPRARKVELVIAKDDDAGEVVVESADLKATHDDDRTLKSAQNTAELMRPFWMGGHVTGEAVLLTGKEGGAATGTLMFQPTGAVLVTSYDGTINYREGEDYTVTGRTLVATAGSRIPQIREATLLQGELAWNIFGGKQVLVSYEHRAAWTGPVQRRVGAELPNTLRKLRAHMPLRIAAFGDSITYGVGSSHMQKIAPFQSPWVDLFVAELKRVWSDPEITLENASQSGADSEWARRMAGRMVGSLAPDLVVIAFGQNDFWNIAGDDFARNIAGVMEAVRSANPQAEFLLVSTMRFDPAYSAKSLYWKRVSDYEARLKAMTGAGVQLVDMTAISGAVYAAKSPRDCLNDPLHPNDYLARWYAQSMMAALAPESDGVETQPSAAVPGTKKGVGDDDRDAPEAIDATAARWYYNWTPRPSTGSIRAEFVPMVWGSQSVDADLGAAVHAGAKELLAFNEPDSASQGNVSVEQAIALWPKLMATGLRLGSPATTTSSPWIDDFMAEAKKRNLRVDFLCLHWYGDITAPDAVGALRTYLQTYWDRYHLPIWLTEFSGADFSFHTRTTTVEDNARFASGAAAMLEALPFVERYAWFGTQWTPESKDYPTSGLYNNKTHALTPVGAAYATAAAQ